MKSSINSRNLKTHSLQKHPLRFSRNQHGTRFHTRKLIICLPTSSNLHMFSDFQLPSMGTWKSQLDATPKWWHKGHDFLFQGISDGWNLSIYVACGSIPWIMILLVTRYVFQYRNSKTFSQFQIFQACSVAAFALLPQVTKMISSSFQVSQH